MIGYKKAMAEAKAMAKAWGYRLLALSFWVIWQVHFILNYYLGITRSDGHGTIHFTELFDK